MRAEREGIFSNFNAGNYDTDIVKIQFEISQRLSIISTDIKSILEKTKDYQGTMKIGNLEEDEWKYSASMPEWKLLLKYLPQGFTVDVGGGCSEILVGYNSTIDYYRKLC